MIIPGHGQDAALGPSSGEVGVAEGVACAVNPRRLAVPHAKHAIVKGAGKEIALLAAPDRGGAKVLVDRLPKEYTAWLQESPGPGRLLIEAPQG